MTTLRIGTDDMNIIQEIRQMVVRKFHFDVQIMEPVRDNPPRTKWAEFAEKMDGIFTPDIIEHIEAGRAEARENFTTDN